MIGKIDIHMTIGGASVLHSIDMPVDAQLGAEGNASHGNRDALLRLRAAGCQPLVLGPLSAADGAGTVG